MTFTLAEKTKILKLKTNLSLVFNNKLKEIDDTPFTRMIRTNCIITGGAISSVFHDQKINDIDLYAKDNVISIKDYIITQMPNYIKQYTSYDMLQKNVPAITENAVTFANDLQFIYIDKAEKCRAQFDFIHCMPWFDILTQKLYISPEQYSSIANKRLIPNPHGQEVKFRRIDKYTLRGWTIDHALYEKARIEARSPVH